MGIFSLVFLMACAPDQEQIVGRFERNPTAGCQSCETRGPLWMEFNAAESAGVIPRYHFRFDDGQRHGGTYQFMQVDTNLTLSLFPDSSSVLYSDLVGQALYTEYTIRANAVRDPCEGLFRNCRWERSE
jgi:hypothetical protein